MIVNWKTVTFLLWGLFNQSAVYAATEDLPFHLDDYGRPLVEIAFSNGEKLDVLLDTAARRTAFTNDVATRQGARRRMRSTIRHFSSAGLLTLPLATLDEILLFGKPIRQNTLALYPDRVSASGLVGFDTLRGQVIRFSQETQTIEMLANSGRLAGEGWARIPGRNNRYMGIILKAQYGEHELDVLVATGSSHTILDRHAANALFPSKDFSVFFGTTQVYQGLPVWPRNLDTITLKNLAIGEWQLGDVDVTVDKLSASDATGVEGSKFLLLGADILMRQNIALDFRDHSVWVPAQTAS